MASFVAQLVKNPPVMRKTWVQSLGWEDPLEKGKATYSGLENSMDTDHGITESDPTERLSLSYLASWVLLLPPPSLVFVTEGVLVAQSCPTLCDPMDCIAHQSPLSMGFQARILEWVDISFSRGSFQPRDQTWVS